MSRRHFPCLLITGFYAGGIILARAVFPPGPGSPSVWALSGGTVVLAALSLWCIRRPRLSTLLLLLALTGFGITYTCLRQELPEDHILGAARYYRNKPLKLRGVLVSEPEQRAAAGGAVKTVFTIAVREILNPWGWQTKSGKVLVQAFCPIEVRYGDFIEIEGKLHRPFNFGTDRNFSYRDFLAARGIYFLLSLKKSATAEILARDRGFPVKALSLRARGRLIKILNTYLSVQEAGLMRAILLGDRSSLNKAVTELFARTGSAHILAISGLHIGVVAGIFLVIAKWIPAGRRVQLALVVIGLAGYAFLTGARPSVIRASVMMSVLLLGVVIEREPNSLNTLFLAAWVLLLFNPLYLLDIGFQLSFLCVLSIVCFNLHSRDTQDPRAEAHPVEGSVPGPGGWRKFIVESMRLSLAIYAGVAGLVTFYFGAFTPVMVIANIFVVPMTGIIVALGFGLLAAGTVFPPAAVPCAMCLKIVLNLMVALVFLCDKLPFSYFPVRTITLWHVIVYYGVLTILLCIVLFKAKLNRRRAWNSGIRQSRPGRQEKIKLGPAESDANLWVRIDKKRRV